jgi:hypothetical protein
MLNGRILSETQRTNAALLESVLALTLVTHR